MLRIFVEGGGGEAATENCKTAFESFLRKAGFAGRMPKVRPCRDRTRARNCYESAIKQGLEAILLVDSEGPVDESCQAGDDFANWRPWKHLEKKSLEANRLEKPAEAADRDCHLMVECTENWSVADADAVQCYFEVVLKNELGKLEKPELIRKADVLNLLKSVAQKSRKRSRREYRKGTHTFGLLREADPKEVAKKCPWARRLIERLEDASKT